MQTATSRQTRPGSKFHHDNPDYFKSPTKKRMSVTGGSIAIIGAGSVGSAIAYSLLLRQVVADIILVDIDHNLCQAQVQDLSDATFLSNVRIRAGKFEDAQKADVIIITAGAKQKPGDTRLDLIDRNLKILKSILHSLQPMRSNTILLIVANPVDILTLFAQRLSGLPKGQVLGSGTLLDSIRLKRIIAGKLHVRFSIEIQSVRQSLNANRSLIPPSTLS